MSKKNWSNILSTLARAALGFVFVFGQTAWAGQGQNAKDKPTSNAVFKLPQTLPSPNTAGSKAQPQAARERTGRAQNLSVEGRSERGGLHEGIAVHGHWSIEVHNPDGSLVRHVEFENSLNPGFSVTESLGGNQSFTEVFAGGAAYLSGLMSGQWSPPIAPVAWEIWLVGPSGLGAVFNPNSTNPPCLLTAPTTTTTVAFTACVISQASPTCTSNSVSACNLSVIPLGTTPNFTGIQLTGSIVATQNGQVSTVATVLSGAICQPSTPGCPPSSLTSGVAGASFTSSSNFPGAPISVSAGQTIAVTVNISFS